MHPDFWEVGIGHRVLERVEEQLVDAAGRRRTCGGLRGNERAIRFYESHGWAADGTGKDLELSVGVVIQEQCHRRDLPSAWPARGRRHQSRGECSS